jgi:hypothetical protein
LQAINNVWKKKMTALRAAATPWQQPTGLDLVAGGYEEYLKAGQS